MPLDQAIETTAERASKPALDKEALLAKYRAERDKRLRADGNAQYLRLERPASPTTSTTPTRRSRSGRRRPTT